MMDVICNQNVATIDKSQAVVDAAARMREEHVGDLIVVETAVHEDASINFALREMLSYGVRRARSCSRTATSSARSPSTTSWSV